MDEVYLTCPDLANAPDDVVAAAFHQIEDELRASRQQQWNPPVVWPLIVAVSAVLVLILPGVTAYRRRQRATVHE